MSLDPITLATITSAVTLFGTKVLEGLGGEAAKTAWDRVTKVFGWQETPNAADLARATAEHLQANPQHAASVVQLLQQQGGNVGMLVGHIEAERVLVAHTIHTVNM